MDGHVARHRLHHDAPQVLERAHGIGAVLVGLHGGVLSFKTGAGAGLGAALPLAPLGEEAALGLVIAKAIDNVPLLLGSRPGEEPALVGVRLHLKLPASGRRGRYRRRGGLGRFGCGGVLWVGVEAHVHVAVTLVYGGAALDGVLCLLDGNLRLVDGHVARLLHPRQNGIEIALGCAACLGGALGLLSALAGLRLGLLPAGAADDDGRMGAAVVDDHSAAIGALNAGLAILGGDGGRTVLFGFHA